jgi:hypothetical protein
MPRRFFVRLPMIAAAAFLLSGGTCLAQAAPAARRSTEIQYRQQ